MQKSDEYTGNPGDVPDILSENLKQIDELLANQNVPIPDRPLVALHRLLTLGAIMEEDGTPVNSKPSQAVDADWFQPIMTWITAWYRLQYGNATRVNSKEPLTGFLLIRKTPFLFHAPSHIVKPGAENGTAWLHLAAVMISSQKPVDTIRSYWERQMAAEAGLKSLLLQQSGSYPHTHDLLKLAGDVAKVHASFSNPCLILFPHWKKAADMRYGTGDAPTWETCYRDYRCIVSTVRECVARWTRVVDLSDARFLLKKPSWA